jgi:hypothetical protein
MTQKKSDGRRKEKDRIIETKKRKPEKGNKQRSKPGKGDG